MFAVLGQYGNGNGKVIKRCKTIVNARKTAYAEIADKVYHDIEIYDESTAKYITFIPNGQRIQNTFGNLIGSVTIQRIGLIQGTRYFHPSLSYPKFKDLKYRRYILKADGTLGEGGY